jgi:transposase
VAAARLARPDLAEFKILTMFEDEGRFGRMSRPMRCWAPLGERPEVKTQLVREYDYAFGAVAPLTGEMDSLILPRCDLEMMKIFLEEVSRRHPQNHILMFMDRAAWHTSKKLVLPFNLTIDHIPPRSPQCNPQEGIWKILRRDHLGNRHFDSLEEVSKATANGLHSLENNPSFIKGLCGFDWIISNLLNAS